jgi:KaiC/GvpD/RAD55 family RecA-like ATPase
MHRTVPPRPSPTGDWRCSFCGYDVPDSPVRGADGASFCSWGCRDAAAAGDEPFAGRFGFKQFTTGVAPLDTLVPRGIPANSFVLLGSYDGARHRGLTTEIVWRALSRGEPAVVITYVDPPVAVVEQFLTFGWNVLPYLESGDLHVVDCFTNRLREEHREPDQQVEWHAFLARFLEDSVTRIRDTTNLETVEDALHDRLRSQEMVGTGVVVVDALDELRTQSQEFGTEQFIEEVRGDVCNRNYVPIFTSTTLTGNSGFAYEHAHLFDGIVETRRTESIRPGLRLRQLGVRKMDGAHSLPHWLTVERTGQGGLQTFDPATQLESVYGSRSGSPSPPGPPTSTPN